MANPFYIEPANPLQALMIGEQSYDRARKQTQEDEANAAWREASELAQSGANPRDVLAKIMATRNPQALTAFSHLQESDANRAFREREAQRSQGNTDREFGLRQSEVGRTQGNTDREFGLKSLQPVKLGANLSGDVYGVRDPESPGGYRIIDINQMRGQQPQPSAQPIQQAAEGIISAVPQGGTDIAPQINAGRQPQTAPQPITPSGRNDAFLKTLPQDQQALVQGLADYNISPTTFSNRGQRERYLAAVKQYDPGFDETEYGNRFLTKKRFTSGPQGNTLRSMNVGIDHLSTLQEYADALKNGDVRIINSISAKFKEQFGYDAPTNFNAVKAIVGSEVSKAIVGSQGALADREEIKHDLTTANSPAQLAGVIAAYKKLMAGQVKGLKQQYEASGLNDFHKYLQPATTKELGLDQGQATATGARAGVPPPPPGFKIVE